MAYIEKCGQRLHKLILGDLKPRKDLDKNDGSLIHREPQTWREAHLVVKSLESIESSARSLQRSYSINVMNQMPGQKSKSRQERQRVSQNSRNSDGPGLAQANNFSQIMAQIMAQGKGKGKGRGKNKGKDPRANQHANNNEKPCNNGKGICFRARDNGTCDIPNCQYAHDREKLREARRNMQMSNELSKAMAAYGFEPKGK